MGRGLTLVMAVVMAVGLGASAMACAPGASVEDPGHNVILVTLDGVRSQEIFGQPPPELAGADTAPAFPLLHASLEHEGVMYGDPTRFDVMTTANPAQRSLPGYMSIFAGFEQKCFDNDCPRTVVETALERIQRQLVLSRGEVATIASWGKMGRAIEHIGGTIYTDIGPSGADAIGATSAPDWHPARWDRDTWAAAMRYLEAARPRLLHIGLLDADGWAHAGDYASYLGTLRQYDRWIAELRARLATLGDYGARTTIIVTTDHGRGDGAGWTDHNPDLPGSERVFLYAVGPQIAGGRWASALARHSSADIRPTLETLFGLEPARCLRCGAVLAEVVGP